MNPLILTFIKGAIPYAIAVAIGFAIAWGVQGLRLTHAEQEFTAYQQEQTANLQKATDEAQSLRDRHTKSAALADKKLDDSIKAGDVYRRCVLAGKCGARVQHNPTACAVDSVQAVSGSYEDGDASIPATGRSAQEIGSCEELANEAATVQNRLNILQAEVEDQPGYKE